MAMAEARSRTPPEALLAAIRLLEWPSIAIGKLAAWVIVPMTGALVYEVISRYVFDRPTVWAYDITYMTAGALFMLGAAFALRNGSHVRADFLLTALRPRWQATIDLLLYIAVYFPAIGIFFWVSLGFATQSVRQQETYPESPWMPYIYPLKIVMPVTLALLLLQGLAEVLKAQWTARTDQPFPPAR